MKPVDEPPHVPAARRPWYADGLKFECQPDCGKCCTRHGEYDYVYLEPQDVANLAALLEMTVETFRSQWTKEDDGYTILRMDGPACPFLDGTRCTVYAARPSQCGTFPFWPENVKSPKTWDDLQSFCPGVGRGDFVPLDVIRGHLRTRPIS